MLIGAEARDECVERFDDALEPLAAAEQALDAGRHQQAGVHQFVAQRVHAGAVERRVGGRGGRGGGAGRSHGEAIVHESFSSVDGRKASSRFEVLAAMRSLLIISGAACRSRRWRPTLYGVPFL